MIRRWNWEQEDWPQFSRESGRLARAEERFLFGSGVFFGSMSHLDAVEQERVAVEAMSGEAVTTSEIEGEMVSRVSVQSSIRRQLGLAAEDVRAKPAERGIAEMMVSLYRTSAAAMTHEMLHGWHRMICAGRGDLHEVGRYRTHEERMVVVSNRLDEPEVHFEAPPSLMMDAEMARFVEWFNRTAPGGSDALPALTRAGMAHLYFVSIHPYEDGNGRVGRAIAEKALAQSVGRPTLTAVAATILRHRKQYYHALEMANKRNEITAWLAWFAGIVLEAQERTSAQVEFLIQKTKLLDRVSGALNERQSKALLRVLQEGVDGFKGGLSAAKYVAITKTSTATATRDLGDMVEKGALRRTGEKRGVRYWAPIEGRAVRRYWIGESGEVVGE